MNILKKILLNNLTPEVQFERTIDWQVVILDESYKVSAYAIEVDYPLSKYKLEADGKLGVAGFYDSKVVLPEIKIKFLCDSEMRLEKFFVLWCESQYYEYDGSMISIFDDQKLADKSYKIITINRLSSESLVTLKNMIPFNVETTGESEMTKLGYNQFRCKIEDVPHYIGTNKAGFREMEVKLIPIVWKDDYSYSKNKEFQPFEAPTPNIMSIG